MRTPTVNQTFDMASPRDMLDKLAYERKRLDAPDLDLPKEAAFITINGAITAWHMCDWIYGAAKDNPRLAELMGSQPRSEKDVQEWARARCPDLVICDHLANAAKHFERGAGRLNPNLETVVEWYRFHRADGTIDVYLGIHVHHDNDFPDVRALLERARIFWAGVIEHLESQP